MRYLKNMEDTKHVCTLAPKEDPLVTYISDGIFVESRRKIKSFFMINPNIPYTRLCFKSSFLIEREKKKHLKSYYYMIHPFSRATQCFNFFILVALFFGIAKLDFTSNHETKKYKISEFCLIALFFCDIIRKFFTGVYRKDFNDTVLNRKKVARDYLTRWLIPDLFTLVPNVSFGETNIYTFVGTVFVIFRIEKFIRVFNEIQKFQQMKVYIFIALRLFMLTLMAIMWVTEAMFEVLSSFPENWGAASDKTLYLAVLKRCFTAFLLFDMSGADSEHLITLLMEIILLNMGYVFYIYSIIQIMQIVHMYTSSTNRHELVKARLHGIADAKNVPHHLKNKLINIFEYLYHRTYFNEYKIMNTLSGEVKKDLLKFYAEKFITRFELFQQLPLNLVIEIMNQMTVKMFFVNDIVLKCGAYGKYIFMIYSGSTAVYGPGGRELYHLYDSDYFGQISMLSGQMCSATVQAVEICKIYVVKYELLADLLEDYSAILAEVLRKANYSLADSGDSKTLLNRTLRKSGIFVAKTSPPRGPGQDK